MSEILKFKVFCIEMYKQKNNMSGSEVYDLFKKYKVMNYIENFYEELHSFGDKYLVEDLELYIEARS
jgi:hypothetical protein